MWQKELGTYLLSKTKRYSTVSESLTMMYLYESYVSTLLKITVQFITNYYLTVCSLFHITSRNRQVSF